MKCNEYFSKMQVIFYGEPGSMFNVVLLKRWVLHSQFSPVNGGGSVDEGKCQYLISYRLTPHLRY